MRSACTIAMVAGEPSGDRLAARVMDVLQADQGGVHVFGIGGDEMAQRGASLCAHVRSLSVMGIADSLCGLGSWLNAWADFRMWCRKTPPDAVLLVDCPEVNLRLGRLLRADGMRVVHYVAPKVWAWRRHRLSVLKECADQVALVFPFESALFSQADVPFRYVGHPLLEETAVPAAISRKQLGVTEKDSVVALLPGSRPAEIRRMGPVMLRLGACLRASGCRPVFCPPAVLLDENLRQQAISSGCSLFSGSARDLLAAADVAVAASGTVTLEAALEETPMVVMYRTDRISYAIARRWIRVPFVSLPNWIAGRPIVPELLQEQATVAALLTETKRLLGPDGSLQRRELRRIRAQFGEIRPSEEVAEMLRTLIVSSAGSPTNRVAEHRLV